MHGKAVTVDCSPARLALPQKKSSHQIILVEKSRISVVVVEPEEHVELVVMDHRRGTGGVGREVAPRADRLPCSLKSIVKAEKGTKGKPMLVEIRLSASSHILLRTFLRKFFNETKIIYCIGMMQL